MGKKKSNAAKSPTTSITSQSSEENGGSNSGFQRDILADATVAQASSSSQDQQYRAVVVSGLSINYHGQEIVLDAELKLYAGNRYGLVGRNGCGKSTLLKCIAAELIKINPEVDFYYVNKEVDATDMGALDAVLSVDREKEMLEAEAERLATDSSTEAEARLNEIYERLDILEADTAASRAGRILAGLGFSKEMQQKKCKDYSGGWRMRIALAQGLFINPSFLLLDEPTNHLDVEAVVWLETYLQKFHGILLVVSHSQDFLNNVCTNIIWMSQQKLKYYKGNYDQYVETRMELEENQMKRYQREQDEVKHMKEYIARFGHGSAKLARQAQSKEKTLAKMVRGGMTEKVVQERSASFDFPDPGKLSGTIIQFLNASFAYPGCKPLFHKLNFGVDLDSRIALVGPNGAGKSTLQKMMAGLLEPTSGIVSRNGHLRMVRFAQHFVDQLPFGLNAIEYMQKEFPELKEIQEIRSILGRFDCTGKTQLQQIGTLSEGQKARVVFAWMAYKSPHILLLDEPTNPLDMETIDALADAINNYEGGVVLVSHDIRLIAQVAKDIWIVEDGKVDKFQGDISDYKAHIRKRIESAADKP